MNNLPKISIVTPSYNQGKFLRETIESVLDQNYPNLEYFIVDGGSIDGSVDIIREYEDRIDWWVSAKDKGQSDAINKGFKKATGELLCWVNSDDVLLPGCLEEVARYYIKNNRPELIHTNFLHIDVNSNVKRMIRILEQTSFFMYRGVWSVSAPSSFFSAQLVREVGYLNPEYHISMDLDLWLRMMRTGARVLYIPRYLGALRWHESSKTSIRLAAQKQKDAGDEEAYIMETDLPGTTVRRRQMWRMVWKVYQVINLNYLRSFLETLTCRGRHWKKLFPVTEQFFL